MIARWWLIPASIGGIVIGVVGMLIFVDKVETGL